MGPNKYYINTSIMMLTFKYMLAYLLWKECAMYHCPNVLFYSVRAPCSFSEKPGFLSQVSGHGEVFSCVAIPKKWQVADTEKRNKNV